MLCFMILVCCVVIHIIFRSGVVCCVLVHAMFCFVRYRQMRKAGGKVAQAATGEHKEKPGFGGKGGAGGTGGGA